MIVQIFSILLCLYLAHVGGNNLTEICQDGGCAKDHLDTADKLSENRHNLNKNCKNETDVNCILDSMVTLINKVKEQTSQIYALDCAELQLAGYNESGNYTVWPKSRVNDGKPLNVYCDMLTDGGGWTVIQRRGDFGKPKDNFYRGWFSYKHGFGDISQDFWLGNDNIYILTNQKLYTVRFDLKSFDGEKAYAMYDRFWIEDETRNYTLHIYNYSGNAGDSMKYHNNQQFSTKDAKNDKSTKHCAQERKGGWWYFNCADVNLNGLYLHAEKNNHESICWYSFRMRDSLETTEIKIRPKNFKKMF